MADVCNCCYYDRDIKGNEPSIECSTCCFWVHKGSSGLSKYDKVCALHKRTNPITGNLKSVYIYVLSYFRKMICFDFSFGIS